MSSNSIIFVSIELKFVFSKEMTSSVKRRRINDLIEIFVLYSQSFPEFDGKGKIIYVIVQINKKDMDEFIDKIEKWAATEDDIKFFSSKSREN